MKKTQTNTVVKNEDNSMILPIEMRVRSLGDHHRMQPTTSHQLDLWYVNQRNTIKLSLHFLQILLHFARKAPFACVLLYNL